MKRILPFLLCLSCITYNVSGWGGIERSSNGAVDRGAPGSPTVVDALGRTLSIAKIPERIVIAGRAVVFIVNTVYLFPGVGARIVGVGQTDQGLGDFYPLLDPEYKEKARFANNVGLEQIAAVRPDLVILKTYMKETLGDALERIGISVLYVDLESPDSFAADIMTLGDVFRQPERARSIIDYYSSRVGAVANAVTASRKPTLLILSFSESGGEKAFSIPPAGWIQTRMAETAGGIPIWKGAGVGNGWSKVSFEQIAAWNPEYVLVVSYRTPAAAVAETLKNSPDWRELRAVKEGTLLPFPADFYSWDQPDTRWILGLQWISSVLHPEGFSAGDLRKEISSFYARLYGISGSTFGAGILPRLSATLPPQ